jgi:hypothetical protein
MKILIPLLLLFVFAAPLQGQQILEEYNKRNDSLLLPKWLLYQKGLPIFFIIILDDHVAAFHCLYSTLLPFIR